MVKHVNMEKIATARRCDQNVVLVVGPSGVGKSAIIRRIERNTDHHRVQSVTSRPPRPDDAADAYTYVSQEAAVQMIERGDFAQYTTHPESGAVYGTLESDYVGGVNILDAMAGAVDGFHKLGFGRVATIGIVANRDEWQRRLHKRYPEGHPEHEGRRREGERCFDWINTHADFVVDTTKIDNDEAARLVDDYIAKNFEK